MAPGEPALDEIRDAFGDQVIGDDGTLNRHAMRRIVFEDDEKRALLESILHPRIRDASWRQAADAKGDYVIIVVPLLFESPMKEKMDRILVIDCEEETQIARLMERDNESRAHACRILATQASRDDRLSIADDVIRIDGDLDDAMTAVKRLHETYLELAGKK